MRIVLCRKSFSYTSYYLILLCIMFDMLEVNVADTPRREVLGKPLESVPAVIVFGDSIVDPGNNNNIKTLVKANFEPYGRDFLGGFPSGRFSNGKVPSDILVEGFGVKELVPPYLDPNLKTEELITGVSFASGASGYDPLTSKIASVISLDDQIELYKKYVERIKAAVGENRTAEIVSKGVYIVCTGSDDIANTYFGTPFRRAKYDVPSYTDLTANSASTFFQKLYGLGARKIGIVSLPPIGCVPSQRTLGGGIERACSEAANQAAILFNSKLSSLIDSLNYKLSDANLVYIDIYNPFLAIIQNPSQYGFEIADKGCCGTGNIEVSILCNRYSPHTCENADKYIFWDSYHPTEKAYKVLVNQIISKYRGRFF